MSWMNSWNGPVIPLRTSVAMAVDTSDTSASRRASTVASAAMPAMKAVPFTRASPSFGSSTSGVRPASRSASAAGLTVPRW